MKREAVEKIGWRAINFFGRVSQILDFEAISQTDHNAEFAIVATRGSVLSIA